MRQTESRRRGAGAATDKSRVLAAVGSLADDVRRELGDTMPKGVRCGARRSPPRRSRRWAPSHTARSSSGPDRFEEALAEYQRAIDLDPGFARAYSGMAGVYTNYFRQPEKAAASYEAAMKHLDRMSEREKYRTLGTYYLDIVRNYEKAIENFETARQVSIRPTTAATATWPWAYMNIGEDPGRADRSPQEPRDLSEEFAAALQLRDVFDVLRRLRHGDQRGAARAGGKPETGVRAICPRRSRSSPRATSRRPPRATVGSRR